MDGSRIPYTIITVYKETETYINFSYLEQSKTRHKCGSDIHFAKDCDVFKTTNPKERENVVNLDFVPDDIKSAESSAVDHEIENEESKSTLRIDTETDTNMSVLNLSLVSQITNNYLFYQINTCKNHQVEKLTLLNLKIYIIG